MSSSKDDITLQQFKADLASHDESFAWNTIAQYPELISQLPVDDLRTFAAKAAMFAVVFSIESGRRHPVTEDILQHIVLEIVPRCSDLELVYYCGNGTHGAHRDNGMH